MSLFKYFIVGFLILASSASPLLAQNEKEPWQSNEPIVFEGSRKLNVRSKKKIMAGMVEFSSKKLDYPPMVFSVINNSGNVLELKAVSEVPSTRSLHPISFRLVLTAHKKEVRFHAGEFYFEDIRLSLNKWLEKYGDSENKRNQRNVEVVYRGIESHVMMSMNELAKHINK